MRSLEPRVAASSEYYNFSPGALAREYLLYVLCVGEFRYEAGYDLRRASFDSFLLEVILDGTVNIETEGETLSAHAGQVVLIDCIYTMIAIRKSDSVQGFNKKMLLALKRGLEKEGMAFFEEAAASDAPRAEKTRQKEKPSSSRDREQKERKPLKERDEKPKKLTEPLPFPEWRKIQKNGKWGFYDGFKTVIPAMYDEVFFFKDGLAAVELDEKCGYIDPENTVVIPLEYETAMSFSEGYACVVKGGKCGYIDKNNEVVVPFIYDAATPFEGGESKVKKDGRWGTLTPDGNVKWI